MFLLASRDLFGEYGISDSGPLSTCFMENETDSHPSPISAYTCHFSSTSGLLITSSIKSNQRPATIILLALLLFSQAFFFYALNLFVKLVRKGFIPLFAAFSFPLVNSVNAFKAATTSLG